jgi:hypothetical protein
MLAISGELALRTASELLSGRFRARNWLHDQASNPSDRCAREMQPGPATSARRRLYGRNHVSGTIVPDRADYALVIVRGLGHGLSAADHAFLVGAEMAA